MSVVASGKTIAGMAALVLAVLLRIGPAQAEDLTFRVVPIGDSSKCVEAIVADGEITNSTPDEFVSFLMRNSQDPHVRSVVLLNSPGGRVVASMQLGQAMRKVGALAIVARAGPRVERGSGVMLTGGGCYSACVYALMGAKKRVIPHGSQVGIHRMFVYEWERDSDTDAMKEMRVYGSSDLKTQLSDYAASMGVSRDLIATAERINPDSIHILTSREIQRWHLGSVKF
jgi:hypothetical protein